MNSESSDKVTKDRTRDPLLESFIVGLEEAEAAGQPESECRMSVVLAVSGLLISGMMITRRRYLHEVLAQLGRMGETRESATATDTEEDKDSVDAKEPKYFIHLMEARFFLSSGYPIPAQGDGFLWRGKLAAVDGFTTSTKLEVTMTEER